MNRPLTVPDLPPPPPGRTGWPWTEASPPLSAKRPDGSEWPKISIVSPSFNQGKFLEETIRSVLLQGYPNLEYVIMDGGSTDGSVEIIRKYAPFLTYWVSQKDSGQCEAINNGFTRVSGDILSWINSDDFFERGAFKLVAQRLSSGSVWLTGGCQALMGDGKPMQLFVPELFGSQVEWVDNLLTGDSCCIPQCSTFWRKEGWTRSGPLREEMVYALDHDFFRLYGDFGPPLTTDQVLSTSRVHPASKTGMASTQFAQENLDIGLRHSGLLPAGRRWRVPFRARKTRGRLALYEAIGQAQKGVLSESARWAMRALRFWPFLVIDVMFLGFLRRYLFTGVRRAVGHVPFARTLYRSASRLGQYLDFIRDYRRFAKLSRQQDSLRPVSWSQRYPCLGEKTPETGFDRHYVYHLGWASRVLAETRPVEHTDIGSSLYFPSMMSAFTRMRFYDIRPPALSLNNLSLGSADLKCLPFSDGSVASLSCMHVLEHVGLGRYGDPLDPRGDAKAMAELSRVLAVGGQLLVVVPVGKPCVAFNAHRIYSYEQVLERFSDLRLRQFALIPDDPKEGGLMIDASAADVSRQTYGCGCFWLEKGAR